MPKINARQAALVGKVMAFIVLFTTFNEVADPLKAFVLALIATQVLSESS
jgi:hypothetical protein